MNGKGLLFFVVLQKHEEMTDEHSALKEFLVYVKKFTTKSQINDY